MECVYLIHFEKKFKHAQHYIGWSADFDKRMECHKKGKGSRLLKAVKAAGIKYTVARIWENKDGNFERKLHNYKKSSSLCPICRGEACQAFTI